MCTSPFLTQITFASDHCIYDRVQLESARCHSTLFGRSRPPNAERNERVSTKRRGATNADSCWRPRRELRCWYASILLLSVGVY